MDAVTYPQKQIIDFLNKEVVALRLPADQKPEADTYNVTWTPALLVLDAEGREHHRVIGFLSATDFIAEVLLGMGKAFFDTGRFADALARFETVMSDYIGVDAIPEAVFMAGVSGYKNSNDPLPLRKAYDYLTEKYSGSTWAKRAYPYRLIGD